MKNKKIIYLAVDSSGTREYIGTNIKNVDIVELLVCDQPIIEGSREEIEEYIKNNPEKFLGTLPFKK